ncbi:unnamed protein product, partial [Ectocarpus sp. 12 AP-2014]
WGGLRIRARLGQHQLLHQRRSKQPGALLRRQRRPLRDRQRRRCRRPYPGRRHYPGSRGSCSHPGARRSNPRTCRRNPRAHRCRRRRHR